MHSFTINQAAGVRIRISDRIPHLPVIKMEWSFGILPADNILQFNVVHWEWLHKNGTKVSPTQTYYFSHKAMHENPLGTEALHIIEVIPLYI